ncbi:MAG: GntR family transcriptional regulator [Dysgonamonadaceae bacterium]|jgi:DNA-binding LacI/PurR family transcriptional regulator|nr:GntR family transcriptional regulator [Dysgonamonadaceae bacterium]
MLVNDSKNNYNSIYKDVKTRIIENDYPSGTLLPTESMLASEYAVSRPTIAKVYNQLQKEGLIKKTKGLGSVVLNHYTPGNITFGLLLPGAGESEIFSIINDQFLKQSESGKFNCLWEGATASDAEIRQTLIDSCCNNYIDKRVDGIFFAPIERVNNSADINLHICNKIKEANIPLILIDRDIKKLPERSDFDVIGLDNFSAGCIMAQHLIDAGCEVIYFFYRPDSATSVNMRLSGIRETVINNKLPFTEDHVYCADPSNLKQIQQIKVYSGKTGIICANDATAAILMSSLDAVNLKIRSDLLICGYDDMKYSSHLKYALTSFRQPCEEIANISIELMMLRVKKHLFSPVTIQLKGEIVPRESSVFI